jgi:hypothetical protein
MFTARTPRSRLLTKLSFSPKYEKAGGKVDVQHQFLQFFAMKE